VNASDVAAANQRARRKVLHIVFFAGVIALDVWLLSTHVRGSVIDRISFALGIVGLYSIVLGFVQRSKELKGFGGFVEGMTSANLLEFVATNLQVLGLLLLTIAPAAGSGSKRTAEHNRLLGALGGVLFLIVPFVVVAYVVFHVLVIMPLAYVAYLLAEAAVDRLASAPTDTLAFATAASGIQSIRLSDVILSDRVASKSYLVGLPATFLALALNLVAKFAA
jgi:hypothetical protein